MELALHVEPGKFSCQVDAQLIKQMINALKKNTDMASIVIKHDGMFTRCMDISHVMVTEIQIPIRCFKQYCVHQDEEFVIGINIEHVVMHLDLTTVADTIYMVYEQGGDRISVQAVNATRVITSEIKLMDIQADAIEIPDMTTNNCIRMPSTELKKICASFTKFGDYIKFNMYIANTNNIIVDFQNGSNSEFGNTMLSYRSEHNGVEDSSGLTLWYKEQSETECALRYVKSFADLTDLDRYIYIFLNASSEVPVRFKYALANYPGAIVLFYLAPKTEEVE